MEKAKAEGVNVSAERKYYPIIKDVRVLKIRLNNAVYVETSGMNKSFDNGREREFCKFRSIKRLKIIKILLNK